MKWTENLTPLDERYGDKFYTEEDGLKESRYVFLQNNDLEARIQEAETFCVGELGFGTGLNFLCTWDLWRKTRKQNSRARLHYMSVDRYPLQPQYIRKALSVWPELTELAEKFLSSHLPLFPGFHRIYLDEGCVCLHLLIGEALPMLRSLNQENFRGVDAWFLDGFAPKKNPEIWSWEVMETIAALSKSKASFATYTSTGWVRRNLETVGFEVQKFKGFGRKFEMLKGRLREGRGRRDQPTKSFQNISIVGAGLSGSFLAHRLSQSGFSGIKIFEAGVRCEGASGNPGLVSMPVLTSELSDTTRLSMTALRFLNDQLKTDDFKNEWRPAPILRLAAHEDEKARFLSGIQSLEASKDWIRWLSADQASEIAGVKVKSEAYILNYGGSILSAELCQKLSSPFLEAQHRLLSYERIADRWRLQFETPQGKREVESEVVILAMASDILKFPQFKDLKLHPNRGQLCQMRATPESSKLKAIVTGEKYILPVVDGIHTLGSSYDRTNLDLSLRPDENKQIFEHLRNNFEHGVLPENPSFINSRASLRTSTPSKIPYCYQADENLWISCGMGSRGLIYSPLCAEIISSELLGNLPVLEKDLRQVLIPS